jgi:hypothetical protein
MAFPALSNWRVWLGTAAMTLGLALAAQRLIPVLYRPEPPKPSVQSADPAIRLAEVQNGVLVIYADVTGARDAADNFDKAAATVSAVGRMLQGGVSDELRGVRTVRFVIRCQAVNRFGQELMAPLVTVETPLAALKAEDYAKARPAQVLGLAQTVQLGAPGAYDAVAAWCADSGRGDKSFCSKAPTS